MAEVKKEIGVKMFIKDKEVRISSPVRSKFDADDNLIVIFKIGDTQDDVKLVFDKRHYLDIQK